MSVTDILVDLSDLAPDVWTPPVWATLPEARRYAVSDAGAVRNRHGELVQRLNPEGYPKVKLVGDDGKRREHFIHRVVARVYLGERPDGALVLHLDSNRRNAAARNLRYGTHADNHLDKVKAGTAGRARRKLSRRDVARFRRSSPARAEELRQEFGLSVSHVREIRNGRKWR